MILILHNLDFENGQHEKFEFNWSISFRDMNFKLILICKFQNVPYALGFEVKYSKFFSISFRACIIFLSMDFIINKLFWP